MLRILLRFIYGSDDQLSLAEQKHLATWRRDYWRSYVPSVFVPASFGLFSGAVALWFLTPNGYQAYATLPVLICSLIMATLCFISLRLPDLAPRAYIPLFSAYTQCILIGYAIAIAVFHHYSDPDYFMMTSVLYAVFGLLILIQIPIYNGWMLFFAIECVGLGMIAWGDDLMSIKGLAWFLIIFLFSSYAVAVNASIHRMMRQNALTDWAKQMLVRQNESLLRQSMEEELALARQLQDSLAPPTALLTCRQGKLRYFQQRHGMTSGDWMAFRELPTGELVVAVADVTGKGLPAAMVAQTIHGLWARMLSQTQFDARQWLGDVNQTLKAMSYSAPHTATLGVLVISDIDITYFSCGHIPALVTHQAGSGLHIQPMMAKGNIVGMYEDLDLVPVTLAFGELAVESIILGTDGIFNQISRIKTKHIQHLLQDLALNGEAALANVDVEDDKMLVVIDRNKPPRLTRRT